MTEVLGLSKKQRLELQRTQLETERASFMSKWRSLNNYILPFAGRFSPTESNKGDRSTKDIINSEATLDARTMSSGMQSGITSPARPWFRLTTPDPDLAEFGSVKQWLHVCTERVRWVLSRTNFYNKTPTIYQDLGVFATACLLEIEDEHRVVRFVDFPVGSFAFGVDENDDPTILTRHFRMTVRQMVRKFGRNQVSMSVRNQFDRGHYNEWVEVVHTIEPNEEYNPDGIYSRENKKFYSCYYEIGQNRTMTDAVFLREGGFEEFPAMIPVWETRGEDIYGTNSPGFAALPDVKMLQRMEQRKLNAIDKMVNPPMTGPTALRTVPASILPGAVTYVDVPEGRRGFQPAHEVKIPLDHLGLEIRSVEARIQRAFFADLFLMLSMMDDQRDGKQPVTAAEIYERHEEKMLALGPVLEQLNQRFLDPIIDRTFNIMERRGLIPPPPPDLEGVDLKVEYISTLHQAQKSSALGGLRSIMEVALPIAEVDPAIMDKIDTDRYMEHIGEAAGVAPDVIRPQDKVDEIRTARAKAQQEAQATELAATQAKAAKDLAASDTSQQNALTDLLGAEEEVPIA